MNAARLHEYHQALKLDQVDEPKATGPFDVVVKIGAAGLCRTDLHIQEGQWAEKSEVVLPYTPGHENAGWVHEIGSGVSNVEVGDTVIVHPFISCGLCTPCRRGDDMHCVNGSFPGINRDGGFADFLLTSARSVVKLDPSLEPASIAALADAGLTAIHAVKKAIPVIGAGTKTVVIGAGGLGHIGIQCLKAYTPTEIIVVDPNEKALALAKELGADHTVKVEGTSHIDTVQELTDGMGAEAIIDFVGEKGAVEDGAHDPVRRLLLRHRLRPEHRHPDDRRDLARDLVDRQPRRDLRRPAGPDDADRAGQSLAAHDHVSARRDQRRDERPRQRTPAGRGILVRRPREHAWGRSSTSTTTRGGGCSRASTRSPTRSR